MELLSLPGEKKKRLYQNDIRYVSTELRAYKTDQHQRLLAEKNVWLNN